MQKIYAITSAYAEELRQFEIKQEEMLANREAYASLTEDDNGETPKNYQVLNGVALYGIQGKMLSSGNWMTRLFGVSTYDDIGDDLAAMAGDESIEKVLISMDTPGGQVAGISDLSDTWQRLNAVKPITVHTAGGIGSAGVWLSSNSNKIYASETADYGSIGVILQHVSQQGALAKAGIKVTEIKSSPLKHVGSPAKDLTTEEREHLQKKVEATSALFERQMYATRPAINSAAFTGEMFSAANATQLGLIDGIDTYSGVFEKLSASAGSDNQYSYKEGISMKKKVTAAMADAAITAGAHPDSLEIVSDEIYNALSDEEKGIIAEGVTPPEGEEQEQEAEATVETLKLLVTSTTELNKVLEAQVEVLQGELTTSTAQVEALTTQVADLTAQLEQSATDPLRVIAEDRIGVMRTALGLTKIEMTDFGATSLLAEYKALDTQFKKNYKSGGHVKANATTAEEKPVKAGKVIGITAANQRATGL